MSSVQFHTKNILNQEEPNVHVQHWHLCDDSKLQDYKTS